jgi:hypothetical protein
MIKDMVDKCDFDFSAERWHGDVPHKQQVMTTKWLRSMLDPVVQKKIQKPGASGGEKDLGIQEIDEPKVDPRDDPSNMTEFNKIPVHSINNPGKRKFEKITTAKSG